MRNAGEASFSLHVLLNADEKPAKLMTDEQLVAGLVSHMGQIRDIHGKRESGRERLNSLRARLGFDDSEALLKYLEKQKESLEEAEERS